MMLNATIGWVVLFLTTLCWVGDRWISGEGTSMVWFAFWSVYVIAAAIQNQNRITEGE